MVEFVRGLELAQTLYAEAVRPILDARFPGLVHSAALIGTSSEVAGFDDERSTDHHWGPRGMLFFSAADLAAHGAAVHEALAAELPPVFRGYSTNFAPPDDEGTQFMRLVDGPPIAHRVEVHEPAAYFQLMIGFDPRDGVSTRDWMMTPQQRLLEMTAGAVFHDGLGALEPARAALAWYPEQVWLYLIACQWQRIAEEEAFVGRTAEAGDELGSAVVAARIVRDVMRLCFLFGRRYASYSKWLGSAFARLDCAPAMTPLLRAALSADAYPKRERALCAVYTAAAELHNALGVTEALDTAVSKYYGRPFMVLNAGRFADATRAAMAPDALAELSAYPGGAIDQWADNTKVLSKTPAFRSLDPRV